MHPKVALGRPFFLPLILGPRPSRPGGPISKPSTRSEPTSAGGLVSDGTNMYGSNCYAGGFCTAAKYFTAAEADDERWSEWPGPKVPMGGSMAFEKGHRLLYSSNMRSGIWRVVVP